MLLAGGRRAHGLRLLAVGGRRRAVGGAHLLVLLGEEVRRQLHGRLEVAHRVRHRALLLLLLLAHVQVGHAADW